MKNTIILLFFILVQGSLFGQSNREMNLIQCFLDYQNSNEYEDSIQYKENGSKLVDALKNVLENDTIFNFQKFKSLADSLEVRFTLQQSEQGDFQIFTMGHQWFYWNFVLHNRKVVLESHKWGEFFTEIHNLTKHEFLLIAEKDELVYGCNFGYVYRGKGEYFKKKKAFGGKDVLTTCNFTHIENIDSHETLPLRTISFDYAQKIISYGDCFHSMTGKTTIGTAKYIRGKFKIKDCDERDDFE